MNTSELNEDRGTAASIRFFTLVLSGFALLGMAASSVAVIVGSVQIWPAFRGFRLLGMLAFCVVTCIGLFCGSAALWLAARPHRATTMRRWRRGFFTAWAASVGIALLLWVLP